MGLAGPPDGRVRCDTCGPPSGLGAALRAIVREGHARRVRLRARRPPTTPGRMHHGRAPPSPLRTIRVTEGLVPMTVLILPIVIAVVLVLLLVAALFLSDRRRR
jgi:hypothetical protein